MVGFPLYSFHLLAKGFEWFLHFSCTSHQQECDLLLKIEASKPIIVFQILYSNSEGKAMASALFKQRNSKTEKSQKLYSLKKPKGNLHHVTFSLKSFEWFELADYLLVYALIMHHLPCVFEPINLVYTPRVSMWILSKWKGEQQIPGGQAAILQPFTCCKPLSNH